MSERPEILETLVLAPGDRLVIVLGGTPSLADADRLHGLLADLGLADRVLMLANIEQLAVLKGEVTG